MVERVKLKRLELETPDDKTHISKISEAVYKERLGPDSVRRMLANDKDDGAKLRGRSEQYDALTRAYIKVFRQMKLLKE